MRDCPRNCQHFCWRPVRNLLGRATDGLFPGLMRNEKKGKSLNCVERRPILPTTIIRLLRNQRFPRIRWLRKRRLSWRQLMWRNWRNMSKGWDCNIICSPFPCSKTKIGYSSRREGGRSIRSTVKRRIRWSRYLKKGPNYKDYIIWRSNRTNRSSKHAFNKKRQKCSSWLQAFKNKNQGWLGKNRLRHQIKLYQDIKKSALWQTVNRITLKICIW